MMRYIKSNKLKMEKEIHEDWWRIIEDRLKQDIKWEKEGKIPKFELGILNETSKGLNVWIVAKCMM